MNREAAEYNAMRTRLRGTTASWNMSRTVQNPKAPSITASMGNAAPTLWKRGAITIKREALGVETGGNGNLFRGCEGEGHPSAGASEGEQIGNHLLQVVDGPDAMAVESYLHGVIIPSCAHDASVRCEGLNRRTAGQRSGRGGAGSRWPGGRASVLERRDVAAGHVARCDGAADGQTLDIHRIVHASIELT